MNRFTIDRQYVASKIPPRRRDSHKGMNGVACVVGGSMLYHGAPYFTAMAAMRVGLDLVYLAVPRAISIPIRALSPDLIVLPLPDARLTRGNVAKLMSWLRDVDCLGLGPGLGSQRPEDVLNCVRVLKEKTKAMVIDADALRPPLLQAARETRMVVTPHLGEFERLFMKKLPPDTEGRVALVSECARESGLTVLMKGPVDIISDGENVGLNETHSPSMTVGGTGDVLTGVTTALVAKGIEPFDAACCAAYINGAAGVEATNRLGLHLLASDVISHLPGVMKAFDAVV